MNIFRRCRKSPACDCCDMCKEHCVCAPEFTNLYSCAGAFKLTAPGKVPGECNSKIDYSHAKDKLKIRIQFNPRFDVVCEDELIESFKTEEAAKEFIRGIQETI